MWRHVVSPEFFETMEIPLARAAAASSARDRTQGAPKVVVINETARAKSTSRTRTRSASASAASPEQTGDIEIVGVLRDAKYDSVRDAPPPTMYVPYRRRGPAQRDVRGADRRRRRGA